MPATNMQAVGGPPEGRRNSPEPGRTFERVQNMTRSSRAPGVAVANLGIVFDTSGCCAADDHSVTARALSAR
jgi:hypothetical protein